MLSVLAHRDRWWRLFLPLIVLLAAVGVACSSDEEGDDVTASPTSAATATSEPTEPPDQQVLRTRITADPTTLDPQQATDAPSLTVLRNLYSTLVGLDESLHPPLDREARM